MTRRLLVGAAGPPPACASPGRRSRSARVHDEDVGAASASSMEARPFSTKETSGAGRSAAVVVRSSEGWSLTTPDISGSRSTAVENASASANRVLLRGRCQHSRPARRVRYRAFADTLSDGLGRSLLNRVHPATSHLRRRFARIEQRRSVELLPNRGCESARTGAKPKASRSMTPWTSVIEGIPESAPPARGRTTAGCDRIR